MSGITSTRAAEVARVVVEVSPPHLDRAFDYAVPAELEGPVLPGQRVMVPFGGRRVRGLVVATSDTTEVAPDRLRPISKRLGDHVWVGEDDLALLRWAARRQGAPLADVVRHALPDRVVAVERSGERAGWWPPRGGAPTGSGTATNGTGGEPPRQPPPAWRRYGETAGPLWAAAQQGGFRAVHWSPTADENAGARLAELAQAVVAAGRQVLVVTPDSESRIAADVAAALDSEQVVDVRGDTSKRMTYRGWLRARAGQPDLLIGERGVSFWPLPRLGLTILLDEANPAAKERRSPRHHAREVLLERARRADCPAVLVGFVPSAPAWRLFRAGRLEVARAARADERASAPLVHLGREDGGPRTRLSPASIRAVRQAVGDGRHAVVLASRRGEGRAWVCSSCGDRSVCPACRAGLEHERNAMRCDACGWVRPRPPRCRSCRSERFSPLAAGAQRFAAELRRTVDVPVAVLEGYAPDAPPPPAVLVCTRGAILDEPPGPVGAVVLADVDALLRRPALDAAEDTLRLCMRAAAWVVEPGGGRDPGRPVIVETDDPGHSAIRALRQWDAFGFWEAEEDLRRPLRFPPCSDAVRLDGPAETGWVEQVRSAVGDGAEVLGPLPTSTGTRVLVKTDDRVTTVDAIARLRREWSQAGVEVRLDVDPVDVA